MSRGSKTPGANIELQRGLDNMEYIIVVMLLIYLITLAVKGR